MLNAIVWDISPYLLTWQEGGLTYYGSCWSCSIFLGYLLSQKMYEWQGISTKNLVTLLQYLLIGGLVGARLGQVFWYDFAYFWAHPLKIFAIWEGGLASHGGAIGILVAIYLYCRTYKDLGYLQGLDMASIVMCMAGAFIRVGNLFNSELYGKITDVSWAFIFVRIDEIPRHPSQLYEAGWLLITFFSLLYLFKQFRNTWKSGIITALFFIFVFSGRFCLEFFKESALIWLNVPLVILGFTLLLYQTNNFKQFKIN